MVRVFDKKLYRAWSHLLVPPLLPNKRIEDMGMRLYKNKKITIGKIWLKLYLVVYTPNNGVIVNQWTIMLWLYILQKQ